MARKRRNEQVWVIVHYEFFDEDVIDCLPVHVSSTRRAAERYIECCTGCAPYSWWQVQLYVVDQDVATEGYDGEETHFYSHKGKRLKSSPVRRAAYEYCRCLKTEEGRRQLEMRKGAKSDSC